MESVNFPRGFLDCPDIPAVASLSSAQKHLWAMCCLHANAAGVVYISATFCAGLGLVASVARQLASELSTRGLLTFDEQTSELFISHWFSWQKTPTGDDKWSRQVTSRLNKVKSGLVRESIQSAIDTADGAPTERMAVVPVPTNLVSSLRHPTPGKRWEATPALLLLAVYTWPTMSWGGVCVADYEALATYVSASGADQIVGHLKDMDSAGNILFDYETGEIFLPARLRNANPAWHMKEILATRAECVSHRVKTNFSRLFTRTFGKFPSKSESCGLVDSTLVDHSFSGAAAPFQDDCWLKSETHPKTATALISLFDSAQKRNKKGSNEQLDVARCRRALEFAEKHFQDDKAPATAIQVLFSKGGWPKDAKTCLEVFKSAAKVNATALSVKAAGQKNSELGNEGRELVGKKLRFANDSVIVVKLLGAKLSGKIVPLATLSRMVIQGEASVVEDQEEAA